MVGGYLFHTGTPLAHGLRRLLQRFAQQLALERPLDVYLAGMAVHLYTASRRTEQNSSDAMPS